MQRGSAGIYFRKRSMEVLRIAREDGAPPGDDWVRVSEETDLGLLKVREILRTGALVDDPREVYWYGMWGDGTLDGATGRLIAKFKRSSEDVRREKGARGGGPRSRLTGVLRSLGRGRPGSRGVT